MYFWMRWRERGYGAAVCFPPVKDVWGRERERESRLITFPAPSPLFLSPVSMNVASVSIQCDSLKCANLWGKPLLGDPVKDPADDPLAGWPKVKETRRIYGSMHAAFHIHVWFQSSTSTRRTVEWYPVCDRNVFQQTTGLDHAFQHTNWMEPIIMENVSGIWAFNGDLSDLINHLRLPLARINILQKHNIT